MNDKGAGFFHARASLGFCRQKKRVLVGSRAKKENRETHELSVLKPTTWERLEIAGERFDGVAVTRGLHSRRDRVVLQFLLLVDNIFFVSTKTCAEEGNVLLMQLSEMLWEGLLAARESFVRTSFRTRAKYVPVLLLFWL